MTRNTKRNLGSIPQFTVGDWQVDFDRSVIRLGEKVVKLEPKVMETLIFLASHAGQTVTRKELEENVWAGSIVGYYSLTGTMNKLRRAFDDNSKKPRVIETLSKKGYRLCAKVDMLPVKNLPADSFVDANIANQSPRVVNKRLLYILSGIMMAVLFGLIYLQNYLQNYLQSYLQNNEVATILRTSSVPEKIISIAVLPFDNHNSDNSSEYFVDGITIDLITDLTQISGLLVISRESTFEYKGKSSDTQLIAKKLGVRYILNGNLRRDGDRVRINAFFGR